MALKTKMKTRVQDTKPVSQAHLDLSTAEIPRKMKMMVSAMLARVFMVYFTVVLDFWEMLASTYLFAPIPQKVILQRATGTCLLYMSLDSRGCPHLQNDLHTTKMTRMKLQLTKK